MKVITHFFIGLALSLGASASINEAWQPNSNPTIVSSFLIKNFSELPLKGQVKESSRLWSGDYWSLAKGNINYRWFAKNKIGHNLDSPSKERARTMTIPELAQLAPSEKFDLFTGRYDYPLRSEVNKIADPRAQIWEGICHGWSPASMNHNEPVAKLMRNPDGIDIPFGSTDIKALLSYYYAYGFKAPDTHQMGHRCYRNALLNDEADCNEDLNAGAFHIVLTNRIGIEGKSFIVDLIRYREVWNHPISAYESQVVSETRPDQNAAATSVKTVRLRTTITYVHENGHDWQPVLGTPKQDYKKVVYYYKLDIGVNGEIIGGNWISKQRPDFIWLESRPRKFEGTLARLGELLNDD
jgi:hypothetical protein